MEFDNNTISSIIVTHQARLKCYLNNFTKSKIHRFMNGCILKITRHTNTRQVITSKDDTDEWLESVELIYNGMIDESKPDYIFYQIDGPTEPNKSDKGNYKIIKFSDFSRKLSKEETKNYNSDLTYIFYVIRHGQAEHNIKENWGALKQLSISNRDTNLTSNSEDKMDGQKQAIETGKNLYDYLIKKKQEYLTEKLNYLNNEKEKMPVELEIAGLNKNNNNTHQEQSIDLHIKKVFVSDLKRTRQTLQNILIGMFQNNSMLTLGETQSDSKINVYILPCSHELAYPKCDSSSFPGAVENTMNCSVSDINADTACKKLSIKDRTIVFDWSKYIEFYGKGTRTRPGTKRQCKETNMISLAIDEFLINNKNIGGTKKKKTRKLKKKSHKSKIKNRRLRKSKKKRKNTRKK